MIFARKPLLWLEKSAFARFCPKVGKEPENPRVVGSIPASGHRVIEARREGREPSTSSIANRRPVPAELTPH